MEKHGHHNPNFFTEPRIREIFGKTLQNKIPFAKWLDVNENNEFVYSHHAEFGGKNCDELADDWFEWVLRTPGGANPIANPGVSYGQSNLGIENPFLKNVGGNDKIYFAGVSPFETPANWRLFLKERYPLFVSVYNMIASTDEYPSLKGPDDPKNPELNNGLLDLILKDLGGIYDMEARFDNEPFDGCCVIRPVPLEVANIPKDNIMGIPVERLGENNSVHIEYGGFFALMKVEKLTPGDHLLYFRAKSINYEIEAKLFISALY
jgi:hypothetical protein